MGGKEDHQPNEYFFPRRERNQSACDFSLSRRIFLPLLWSGAFARVLFPFLVTMLMVSLLRSEKFKKADEAAQAAPKTDLEEAQRWTAEGRKAVRKSDWTRAVVCYRRALLHAPFSHSLRNEFAVALEGQILSRMDEQEAADFDSSAEFGTAFDDDDEAAGIGSIKIPRPSMPNISTGQVANFLASGPLRYGLTAAAGILVAGGLLFAASAAATKIGDAFGPRNLPTVTTVSIPEELTNSLSEAQRLVMSGDRNEGIESLKQLASTYPDHAETQINPLLSRAYRLQGIEHQQKRDYVGAAEAYAMATEYDPSNLDNWIDLGQSWRNEGQIGSARSTSEKREALNKAESAFEKALNIDSQSALVVFQLAQVKAAQNERKEAIANYERVISLAPDSTQARLAQTQLAQLKR